eukprot:gene21280-27573_t
MKFGEYLKEHTDPDKINYYLNYDLLKNVIKELEDLEFGNLQTDDSAINVRSLTLPHPTNAAAQPIKLANIEANQEMFFSMVEQEMRKIERFTREQVQEIRSVINDVENQIKLNSFKNNKIKIDELKHRLEKAGEDFLKLEKFVNLNFTGFHKILKKHDRRLPNPCKAFYMARLREQSWVRGDYSDVIVILSRAFGALRGDDEPEAKETEKQAFVRSTRKYWVHTEDISRVKYIILQHLPVFLQKTMAGETDSQLVNSVYLDNILMELYQGRLDKSPGAIALRFRWYGTGTPELVFVERKTHRDSWTGEVSVKERFTINESQVLSLLNDTFNIELEKQKLVNKGKSEEEINEWYQLVQEIYQAISSKQLIPTLRTQYMRTAFQIPFDASVRISLDTNLCMITERTKEQLNGKRWYRDPSKPVPSNEITRLPYAVLEVKLQLLGENDTPQWVTDLIDSGMLIEIHKFSKFIHGSAVLFADEVHAMPYWIDDATLAASIRQSGAGDILIHPNDNSSANTIYKHLLPHNDQGERKSLYRKSVNNNIKPIPQIATSYQNAITTNEETGEIGYYAGQENLCVSQWCEWASAMNVDHVTTQKVEPKLFFANERTFMKWLEMAVVMSSVSVGVLAFTQTDNSAQYFAVVILPLALLFIGYALWTFFWRSELIKTRDTNRWDDPVEIGLDNYNELPDIAKEICQLVGYQRLALQIIGSFKSPVSKKKTPMSWDDILTLIMELRNELGL